MLRCSSLSSSSNIGVKLTDSEGEKIQSAQLEQYVSGLRPLTYWRRETVAQSISSNNAIKKRSNMFFTAPSKAVSGCTGVYAFSNIVRNTGLQYEYKKTLLDGYGWLMTYNEFKRMPTACYTAVEIDESEMRTFCPIEQKKLILVLHPRSMAAKVVSCRGPDVRRSGIIYTNL